MELEDIIRKEYPMSDEGLDLLRPLLRTVVYPKKTILVKAGEVSTSFYIIKKGICRNFMLINGYERTRWFAEEGDMACSMFSFARSEPAPDFIDAVTEVEAYVADIKDIRNLLIESDEWAKWTTQYLIDGLYVLADRSISIGEGEAYDKYRKLQKARSNEFFQNVPLQYIASYLYMTPQTLSRIRRKIVRGEKSGSSKS